MLLIKPKDYITSFNIHLFRMHKHRFESDSLIPDFFSILRFVAISNRANAFYISLAKRTSIMHKHYKVIHSYYFNRKYVITAIRV